MRFLLRIKSIDSPIVFDFRDDGLFSGIQLPISLTENQVAYIAARIPLKIDELEDLTQLINGSRIEKVPEDLSFDAFWEKYNYKVGNKGQAKKLWTALADVDKAICLSKISTYDQYLSMHLRMEKAYPTTFLNQRRWENQF